MIDPDKLIGFLHEDAPYGDITSEALVPADLRAKAAILAKEPCVIAGLEEAAFIFTYLGAVIVAAVEDGEAVAAGTIVMTIEGPARAILQAERPALNLIGRMSGIATATRAAAECARAVNPAVRVAPTRKTAPGLRALDKKAAMIGGGEPHRFSLSDMFLIKDNHLALVGIEEAVRRAKAFSRYHKIEVEAESTEDAVLAARAGADLVLLDNMTPAGVAETVEALRIAGLKDRVAIEVSGRVTAETLPAYAGAGADIISMGALTHTVRNIDVGLDIA
jgi:nicotinate-nucleotide pyrophosphorylase (carboxylating)